MKTIKNLLSGLATLMIAMFATSAMAQESSCGGDTCVDEMPDMSNLLTLDITSFAGVAGVGEVNGIGDEFVGRVDKESFLQIDTTVSGDTDLCGSDCTDFNVEFDGQAIESISSIGAALSTTPGNAAGVSNTSQALSQLGLTIDVGGSLTDDDGS